ncbi:UDP-3-O-acylglucosamine N-acyltransferase [Striga asiatica]|uniref:UDP-3-O-acylglucosamine N-acyltransferase n=1 Tax=Striga asiatica TaxID=4170 RepID=A0A5A7QJZ8_STRAF|nr:UDP-3-O-acylglucosamine N-acyltransferase [Striga asiatica]
MARGGLADGLRRSLVAVRDGVLRPLRWCGCVGWWCLIRVGSGSGCLPSVVVSRPRVRSEARSPRFLRSSGVQVGDTDTSGPSPVVMAGSWVGVCGVRSGLGCPDVGRLLSRGGSGIGIEARPIGSFGSGGPRPWILLWDGWPLFSWFENVTDFNR